MTCFRRLHSCQRGRRPFKRGYTLLQHLVDPLRSTKTCSTIHQVLLRRTSRRHVTFAAGSRPDRVRDVAEERKVYLTLFTDVYLTLRVFVPRTRIEKCAEVNQYVRRVKGHTLFDVQYRSTFWMYYCQGETGGQVRERTSITSTIDVQPTTYYCNIAKKYNEIRYS